MVPFVGLRVLLTNALISSALIPFESVLILVLILELKTEFVFISAAPPTITRRGADDSYPIDKLFPTVTSDGADAPSPKSKLPETVISDGTFAP